MRCLTIWFLRRRDVVAKDKPAYDAFKAKYKKRFGNDVQMYSPYTYDSVKLMVAAMVKADSSDPVKYLPHWLRPATRV